MSFIGAVASSVRRVLAHYGKNIQNPALIVGAGNFTVPAVLRSAGYTGPISACDVSLYTSALGAYLSGGILPVQQKKDCPDHLKGLLDPATPLSTAATIAMLCDLRDVWKISNPYQERMFNAAASTWDERKTKTCQKLEVYKVHLEPIYYCAQDGFDFLQEHGQDHTVFAIPPTYKSGYERLERILQAAVSWPVPNYREMTDKSMDLYNLIAGFNEYFVVLEKDLSEVYTILGDPVAVLPRGRDKQTFILAKTVDKKIVVRTQSPTATVGSIWPAENKINGAEKLTLAPLSLAQTLRLNELFLAAGINYFSGGVGVSLGFFLDGRLFGKVDFSPTTYQWKLPEEKPMIYIMSDLAVTSRVRRLSKLVLMCLLSKDVKQILDLKYVENFGYACTTAFSKHPVSMKYRGIFKMHKRLDDPEGFRLNYFADFGEYGMGEVLRLWGEKYG